MTNNEAKAIVAEVKEKNPGVSGKKLQTLVGMEANRKKIKDMLDSGYSVTEIAKQLGISESTVRNTLK